MTIKIGGGQGFYGDGQSPLAALLNEQLDYFVCEALAELTLAILAKDRMKDESLGYTRDLGLYVLQAVPHIVGHGMKMITNAGGINPRGAGDAVLRGLHDADIRGVRVATVIGDDVRKSGEVLDLDPTVIFAHAYLGAAPIVAALADGADIVITGRVADASLFLAPLIYEFGWSFDDFDKLAAGVVVGHLLECSGQVTGGNYSGAWWKNKNPQAIGFPIAECEPDGSAIITKPRGTGGFVTFDTVREQLLYEVHDPAKYLNPDVTADFSQTVLTDLGDDRVQVSGTRGTPPPDTYKVLVCRPDGFMGEARVAYGWPDAEAKARAAVDFVKKRAEELGIPIEQWHEEYFGAGAFAVGTQSRAEQGDPSEVIGRVAWRCASREDAGRLLRELGVLGLSGPPMIATALRGTGRPSQLLAIDARGIDRRVVDNDVKVTVTSS